jgi:hypothetical protein
MALAFWRRTKRSVAGGLESIGRDLMTLEINTIVKNTMTAEPTPPWPHAALELLREYAGFLAGHGWPVNAYIECSDTTWPVLRESEAKAPLARSLSDSPADFQRDAVLLGLRTVDRIRWAARGASVAMQRAGGRGPQAVIADRIVGNCDALKNILRRASKTLEDSGGGSDKLRSLIKALAATEDELKDGKAEKGCSRADLIDLLDDATEADRIMAALDIRDTSKLRKMWEIGIEEVVAQTVVQLDGDVVTRFRSGLDASGQGVSVLEAHRAAVDVSLSSWRYLVDAALRLIRPFGLR